MALLQEVTINNFRGFDKLEIKGFSKVNLLVGKNNCGKSSLLEALLLLLGMSNPYMAEYVNRFRGLRLKNGDELRYLFNNLNLDNLPYFTGKFDNHSRYLTLKPLYDNYIDNNNDTTVSNIYSQSMIGLQFDFSIQDNELQKNNYQSRIIIEGLNINPQIRGDYQETLQAVYIASYNNHQYAQSAFSQIVKHKKTSSVLETIKKIDPKIQDIQYLQEGIFLDYADIDELIPIHLAGEGVKRFFSIITAIVNTDNKMVFIDEIENGLHYTAHKSLWESILTISKELDVQLFITTHNEETLSYLHKILTEPTYQDEQENVSVFTLSHTRKAGIKAYRYGFSEFHNAIETETEIRV